MPGFSEEVVTAICSYMNSDPMESNLTIVIGHTHDRSYTAARLVTFDGYGATFEAERAPGRVDTVVVPWQREITERAEVREQLLALWQDALSDFGSGS